MAGLEYVDSGLKLSKRKKYVGARSSFVFRSAPDVDFPAVVPRCETIHEAFLFPHQHHLNLVQRTASPRRDEVARVFQRLEASARQTKQRPFCRENPHGWQLKGEV